MFPYRKALPAAPCRKQKMLTARSKTQTGSKFAVVKAQIHAGGRGKGTIKENGINGVKVAKSLEDVQEFARKYLGGTLVTIQTGPAGKVVNKIFVAQDMYYDGPSERKEFYLSILLDRTQRTKCDHVQHRRRNEY